MYYLMLYLLLPLALAIPLPGLARLGAPRPLLLPPLDEALLVGAPLPLPRFAAALVLFGAGVIGCSTNVSFVMKVVSASCSLLGRVEGCNEASRSASLASSSTLLYDSNIGASGKSTVKAFIINP